MVAHVGLHALGAFADRLRLGDALSAAMPWQGPGVPVHDRGKVLVHSALMLAGGGECCSDIEYLRLGTDLFGSVPSDTTVARTFTGITPQVRASVADAMAVMRAQVWSRSPATVGPGPVILDIDASLVEVHSENKEPAAPTFKGGYGFHPIFCFADATGETLAGLLRAGNAGANTLDDHVTVLDAAVNQLPAWIATRHRAGDDEAMAGREVIVRADSACLIDDPKLPEGTRLILRREPLHPGAQRSLFPSMNYRYWGFYTDRDGDPRDLDLMVRAHAHVEQHIGRLKDSVLCRSPFANFDANAAWMMAVGLAADLVRWFQLCCLPDEWHDTRPKTLRWRIFGAPGRLIRTGRQRIVRVIEGWPTSQTICDAYQRIALIT